MTQLLTEARCFTGRDMARAEPQTLAPGSAVVLTTRSPGRETGNEDAAALLPVDETRTILAVADGVGGHAAGAEAAAATLGAIVESVRHAAREGTALRPAILNGIEAANARLCEGGIGAGTTVALVEIDGLTARPYHVGDSAILIIGQRGRTRLQTVAHSPVGYAIESGLLDEREAIHHEDRHLVSNIVGSPDMRIEVGPVIALRPRDTVVLGSDGLFDNLHTEEVIDIVRKGPLSAAAETLAATCRERMLEPEPGRASKADDLTFILYRPHPPRR